MESLENTITELKVYQDSDASLRAKVSTYLVYNQQYQKVRQRRLYTDKFMGPILVSTRTRPHKQPQSRRHSPRLTLDLSPLLVDLRC